MMLALGKRGKSKGLFGWRRAKVINELGNQVELQYCDGLMGRTFTADRATMLKYSHLYRPVTNSD